MCSCQHDKRQNKRANSKAQTKRCVASTGGSLTSSFHFVPLSQHLPETKKEIETDNAGGAGRRQGPLSAHGDVSFEHTLLSLSHTLICEDDSALRQCDNMLVGHSVPSTVWGGVCLRNQTDSLCRS